MTNFEKVNLKQSFPKLEENILKFWEENKIFEESVNTRENSEEFNFYDGPPFATGTPHYGHILAGTIKDVIPRYQTMKWKKVDRKFGWDCHGLPIENIVEKKLEISGKDEIEKKIWVHTFNETCRENVFTYAQEWQKTVKRMGRWVDMENDYKTMDTPFMESVWWVYKTLYDKWLIYEWHRVVPYCPRCSTPLSNFEVNQGYKNKQDKTATVKFKIEGKENKYILAWTTTPWTLVANLWLAVWKDLEYTQITDKKTNETYILAKDRLSSYYKNEEDCEILQTIKWKDLIGIKYEPVFDDFSKLSQENKLPQEIALWKNSYTVVAWHHVTTESGTWIVHIAPAYWEDDALIWKEQNLGFVSHINDLWKTENLQKNNNIPVFEFNEIALQKLKDEKQTIQINTIDHSYPHCWRCDSPLIYRAIWAWYVAVEKIRDKMVVNNEKINWTPDNIKHGRFGTWIAQARDWNISRNRYWGSAIPVWQSEDKKEEVCIGSVQELYELNKEFWQIEEKNGEYFYTNTNKPIDIHKHLVDEIFLKHPKTWTKLKRVPEVLDCWFESGSMPYASKHYPFEKQENFKFPADFIAEWLDQTRGWFYTLLILGTALFDNTPFLNCIVNGTVLAEDGHKMSKSKQNYPDPNIIFNKYGADALRFYLMNSPVVEAQDFRFSENGVEEVLKKVILPLWNTYYFFTTYANIDNFKLEKWNIFYCRHWQTTNNAKWTMNWWDSESELTEKWKNQARETAKKFKLSGIKLDKIIASNKKRAIDTANIIKKELWYTHEIEINENFNEQLAGKFKNKSLEEIANEYWIDINDKTSIRKIYKNKKYNGIEGIEEFERRILKAFETTKKENKWKNVLIVGHSGTFRPIHKIIKNLSTEEAYYSTASCPNAKIIKLNNINLNNPLDKWIISELHSLIKEVNTWFETYKLNDATKPIVKFMDNLTNWYIRRSRKRFWKSENDWDKIEAYNTLYEVLIELSKVTAPFMPFISEHIYKELTKKESVHLETFPESMESYILKDLNESTQKIQNIITLWLAFRANNKIRVRQPLQSITITEKLKNYYIEIIKEELNVKKVIVVDPNTLAKKICKPNGRTIWPKFGSDVKFIMSEAKTWNFEELPSGNITVWKFELEKEDFEIEFIPQESSKRIEAWFWIIVSMDDNITEELKQEWYARDIVRHIQEARKEAWYNVEDRIQINISWERTKEILDTFTQYIETETLSKIHNNISSPDLEKIVDLDDMKIKLTLSK
jgi:isoleucyl-tRNA synthetase